MHEGRDRVYERNGGERLTQFEEEIERNNFIEAVAAYHVRFEDLRKLVGKMAVQAGLAKPVERPEYRITGRIKKEMEFWYLQKILLTWLIESEDIFRQIEKYITEDFRKSPSKRCAGVFSICRVFTFNRPCGWYF